MPFYAKQNREEEERQTFYQKELRRVNNQVLFGQDEDKTIGDVLGDVKDAAVGVGKSVAENYQRLGEGTAEVIHELTGGAQAERDQMEQSNQQDLSLIRRYGEIINDKNSSDEQKSRARDALSSLMKTSDEQHATFQKRQDEIIERTDPVKGAAAVAGVGLDVLTAGAGGAAIRGGKAAVEAGETGLKIAQRGDAAKKAAETAARAVTNPATRKEAVAGGAGIGSAYGVQGEVEDKGANVTAGDLASGAIVGGGTGAVLGGVVKSVSEALAARKGASAPTRVDEVKAAESPMVQILAQQSPEVQQRLSSAIAADREFADFALTANAEQANALIAQVEGQHAQRLNSAAPATEAKTSDLTSGVQPQNANMEAPIGGLDALERAATSSDPARTMAAEVTPGQPSLSMELPQQPRNAAAEVTPGAQNETKINAEDVLSPEEQAAMALKGQAPKKEVTSSGTDLTSTIERQRQGIEGLGVEKLDNEALSKLKGTVRDSGITEFTRGITKNASDPVTYLSKRVGKEGADFAYGMAQGAKFKSDNLDALREPLKDIQKLSKNLYGKTEADRVIGGENMIKALSDRQNASKYLKTPEEMKLYDKYVQVFDHIRNLREEAGLSTLEDYAPWARLGKESEEPTWLADAFTGERMTPGEDIRSRFSKHRTAKEMGEDIDTNLSDSVFGYVNSQLNELAYMEPVAKFQEAQGGVNVGKVLNKQGMNEARNYMQKMVRNAITPEASSGLDKTVDKIRSNVYQNILRGNIKNGLQNYSQLFITNSEVSREANSIARSFSKEEQKEILKDVAFGSRTVTGELPAGVENRAGLTDALDKIDPYTRSEAKSVNKPYLKGYAQGLIDSPAYKKAIEGGADKNAALQAAKADPEAQYLAARRGNILVNNTTFGANAYARPIALQNPTFLNSKAVGKALTMFIRFPIGMSQHIVENLGNIKNTRALDMFRYGDPRGVPLAEMRDNYKALASVVEDSLKAKTDVGIPKDVLQQQAAMIKKNVGIIDEEIKKLSQRSKGKSAANLTKMWAAAAAIQYAFDAGGSLLSGDEQGPSVGKAIDKSDPTVRGWFVGENSKLSGLGSPLSPVDKYGRLTSRPVLNAIPGAGFANRLSGNGISNFIDDTLRGKREE